MSTPKLAVGDLLADRYEIRSYHAAGSMQEVYTCYDRALDRDVVLKTPIGTAEDKRFKRGAEMGAHISHHNVATTLDYSEEGPIVFMVEELISGVDLEKRLTGDFEFLDPALTAHVIHHIARALYEAHRLGIIHRDLKPSNVMTSTDPEMAIIKLTDFGIAKLAEDQIADEMKLFEKDRSTLTTSHTLLGAIPYMAPECWANWSAAGKPMDIWALGCIGYQLLTGNLPFGTGRGAIAAVIKAETLGKVSLNKPTWFGKHLATKKLEDELWALLMSCLKIAPDERVTAAKAVEICDALCYATSQREVGTVTTYPGKYSTGTKGDFGYIRNAAGDTSYFFHSSVFYGSATPAAGQRVSYCIYPGDPKPRLSPVLLLRP